MSDQTSSSRRRGYWVGFVFLAGLAAAFWWVAFAGDPRDCSASLGPIDLGPRVCHIGFGFGAALCTAYALYILRVLLIPRRSRSHY